MLVVYFLPSGRTLHSLRNENKCYCRNNALDISMSLDASENCYSDHLYLRPLRLPRDGKQCSRERSVEKSVSLVVARGWIQKEKRAIFADGDRGWGVNTWRLCGCLPRIKSLLTRAEARRALRLMLPSFYDNCKLSCRGNADAFRTCTGSPGLFYALGMGRGHEVDGWSVVKRVEDGGS